ncbi:intercellular adhesion molecule 3-like [Arapaima gigas]
MLGFVILLFLAGVCLLRPLSCVSVEADVCPIEINPPSLVVRYGDPVTVNCTVSTDHLGMGWVAPQKSVNRQTGVQSVLWTVEHLTTWDITPQCFANIAGRPQCSKQVSVTVYATPDNVSMNFVNHTGPLEEGRHYQLLCNVQNVAPVQNFRMKWYKGKDIVKITHFYGKFKTPLNVSSTLLITPSGADDGAQYRCEAELDLGPEGPQPPPAVQSEPLRVTVYYAPHLSGSPSEVIEVNKGDEVTLNCTARGNPPPVYTWSTSLSQKNLENQSVIISSTLLSGNYTCTASNQIGTMRKLFTIQHKPGSQATFWIVIGVGVTVAAVLIIGYIIRRYKQNKFQNFWRVQQADCRLQ